MTKRDVRKRCSQRLRWTAQGYSGRSDEWAKEGKRERTCERKRESTSNKEKRLWLQSE